MFFIHSWKLLKIVSWKS